ncbi:hypothetical protein TELCIR_15057, partial [Teladorsagia circumcincta]
EGCGTTKACLFKPSGCDPNLDCTLGLIFFGEGCGTTKACLFKPSGCDPNLDCTLGLIFFVVGPNQLRVEMVGTSLIPAVPQQYIAIAFSNDAIMGDDFVTECVLSDMGPFAGWEPEIFVSFNHGKANDRIYLNDEEHRQFITNVSSQVVDGRLFDLPTSVNNEARKSESEVVEMASGSSSTPSTSMSEAESTSVGSLENENSSTVQWEKANSSKFVGIGCSRPLESPQARLIIDGELMPAIITE